jgi:hypothetical protein
MHAPWKRFTFGRFLVCYFKDFYEFGPTRAMLKVSHARVAAGQEENKATRVPKD